MSEVGLQQVTTFVSICFVRDNTRRDRPQLSREEHYPVDADLKPGAPLYRIFKGVCNAAILQDFLEHLVFPWFAGLTRITHRRIAIMDNVRFHHSQIVKDVFTGDVVQKFLPPYSSQLNPIEEVSGFPSRTSKT